METKEYVLVRWSDNWADEMNLEGFQVFLKEAWEGRKKEIEEIKSSFIMGCGTNEEIEYSDGNELLNKIEVTKITPLEATVLQELFNGSYGFDHFLEIYIEDEEEEEY